MILHVDMDAFYASVEERERPELRGRPVVVGGRPEGRGVVAAANYVARAYGVRSAMPAAQAKRLCPQAVFLPPRISFYAQESQRIRAIFERYTPLVEPLSLDEAFLDVDASARLFGSARYIAETIKNEIRDEIGLVASVGVAPNKFVAKIASDFDKPDGLVCVEPAAMQSFLDVLPIGSLWGVGHATGQRFSHMGVRTIAQLRAQPKALLFELFGRQGEHLWRLAHGIDDRVVSPEREAKSISHETTFAADVESVDELRAHLQQLVEQVAERLRRAEHKARRVQIKIRFDDFHTITRVSSFAQPTDSTRMIRTAAERLLFDNIERRASNPGYLSRLVRLVGAGVAGLGGDRAVGVQADLFGDQAPGQPQSPGRSFAPQAEGTGEVDRVFDRIRERFGAQALRRGRRPPRS